MSWREPFDLSFYSVPPLDPVWDKPVPIPAAVALVSSRAHPVSSNTVLFWDAVEHAASYRVEQLVEGSLWQETGTTATPEFEVTPEFWLTGFFRVRAYNSAGVSGPASSVFNVAP